MAQRMRLRATQWLPRGEALAEREDGPPVAIWKGIVGEDADVEIGWRGNNRWEARWKGTTTPSPHRRKPPCDKMDACGGCPLMHLTVAGQQQARLALVRAELAGVGLEALAPLEVVPSPDGEEGHRHVAKLAVGRTDQGKVVVGGFGRGDRRVVAIPDCHVVTPTLRDLTSEVAHQVIRHELWPYDPKTDKGTLRYIVLRQSRTSGQVLITVVAGRKSEHLFDCFHEVARTRTTVAGIHVHFHDGDDNAIFSRDEEGVIGIRRLHGADIIEETIAGETVGIGPTDFFQTNPAMADRLARDVREALVHDRARPVLDLFCGVGALTLPLARAHGYALGVEVLAPAVARARDNAARARVSAEFLAGPTAEVLPSLRTRFEGRGPAVVVDPNRAGLGPAVVDDIVALQPSRVVSVSCDPRTFALDLARFVEQGFAVDWVRAYDMFPQTSHVELLARLSPTVAPVADKRAPRRKVVR